MLSALIDEITYLPGARTLGRIALPVLALASASCVPVANFQAPSIGVGTGVAPSSASVSAPAPATPLAAAAIAAPIAPLQASSTRIAFEGHTALDRLRSLDCLAQAI